MTIEISDIKYWKPLNYDDAILYCSLLEIGGKNDWRMMTRMEYIDCGRTNIEKYLFQMDVGMWFEGDDIELRWVGHTYYVIPVRDNIKPS